MAAVMTAASEAQLPKYIQNANRIIEVLSDQPERSWAKTQRELGERLGFAQPELSTLLKLLFEHGKIRRGAPLPGVRGRNYVIELVDDTPFMGPVARRRRTVDGERDPEDRPLRPEEEIPANVMSLADLTVDTIGAAVLRALNDAWSKERRHAEIRSEQIARLRQFQEQMSEDRKVRMRLATEKEALERQLHDLEHQQQQLRAEVNRLLIANNARQRGSGGSYQIRDLLPEEDLKTLEALMKGKPGHYRESDQELGL